jgi:O-phosphoseryl-tRNA(Cys) synthetase
MRFLFVMPVIVTGIHVWKQFGNEAVDGRDKPGHDQLETKAD